MKVSCQVSVCAESIASPSVWILEKSPLSRFVDPTTQKDPVRGHPTSWQKVGAVVTLGWIWDDGVGRSQTLVHHTQELPVPWEGERQILSACACKI